MSEARYQQIKGLIDTFDDLPDGAFLAVPAENGVDTDDLYAYSKEYDRREANTKKKRR